MSRARKPTSEKLNDSINVPMNRDLKRRVVRLAGQCPGKPKPTRFSRIVLEQFVERAERDPAELAAVAG